MLATWLTNKLQSSKTLFCNINIYLISSFLKKILLNFKLQAKGKLTQQQLAFPLF